MARTDEQSVNALVSPAAGQSVLPFIQTATTLVDYHLAAEDPPLPTDLLTEIEKWLAAHLFACTYPRTVEESAGPVTDKFQSAVGLGLDLTHFGQQVKLLDPTGKLALVAAGKPRRKAKTHWMGTEYE